MRTIHPSILFCVIPYQALIEHFRGRFPGAPVLVCSGHLKEELVRREVAAGSVDFLAKPFKGAELVRRVGTLLSGG